MIKSAEMTLTPHRPNLFQRLALRLAATRWAGEVLRRLLRPIDRIMLDHSGGRQSLTSIATGLPVIQLTTVGAKSGEPRTNPLLAGVDGERLVLFPTNFGREQAPGWLHNLRANPEVKVTYRQEERRYRAREASAAEQESYWKLGDSFYPGYKAYRERVLTRSIPVIVLEPGGDQE